MIVVRVHLKAKPEAETEFVKLMNEDTAHSRGFAGCQTFQLFKNEAGFLLYEEWDTQENFDLYLNSGYLEGRRQLLFPLLDGAPDAAYYTAERFN